ncbi:MAG: TorF family putative porin [Gammaproteobacteria bacterium]|nr:TorF family putative porin [Gammaproteobacteria bacterium]MBQ0839645.1 TorF family putative porin [Gammaproteobacteria bacterium]
MAAATVALSGAVTIASPAMAEVSASAAVANMYLWRGIDLGDGSAAVSGDLVYSNSGAYVGVWVSSGDDTLGNEYDYFAGYGGEVGDFTYDLSLWNYNYSDDGLAGNGFDISDDTTGELSEIIVTLGYAGISLSYYDNIAGATGYSYTTLSGGVGKFSATLGYHDLSEAGPTESDSMTHFDVSYAFNDNLSFTASKVVAQDCDKDDTGCSGTLDEDLKFVVTYSLPITM